MYTAAAARYIMDWDLIKWLSYFYFHQGRTDQNGGHRVWRIGSGFGQYHYHHGLPAHDHVDGNCPHREQIASIINPFTGGRISLGQAHFRPFHSEDEDIPNTAYYSLNLVSKALTADSDLGVILTEGNTGGKFYACSEGVSSEAKLGEELKFSYPRNFLGIRQSDTLFKTDNNEMELLCHTGKSDADTIDCYAYVSLEEIRKYMMKGGYFTDFADSESGVWRFNARRPRVQIITPRAEESFEVGDELIVRANIQNVANARMTAGNSIDEVRTDLEVESTVIFDKFKLTEEHIGSLAVRIRVDNGGTTTGSEINTIAQIQVNEPIKGRVVYIPSIVNGVVNGVPMILDPINRWAMPGTGRYTGFANKDEYGRYKIAVGSKIVNPKYPDDGKIWASDFEHTPKRINVTTEHKHTGEIRVFECTVTDYKAHTYNKYIDGHPFDTGDTASFDVENGLLQTGIAYPKSSNASQNLAFAPNNIDSSVIEFCSDTLDFQFSEYRLLKVFVLEE